MLHLVNEVRADAGVPQVVMGNNQAAQVHADNSLANCVSSHYSTDGLQGVMRYSLSGGHQANSENVYGSDYCRTGELGYSEISSIAEEVRDSVRFWMGSSGHSKTMLNPRHRKLNIGLAWDSHNFHAVQQFESDHIVFTTPPQIKSEVLYMEGILRNGANLEHGDHYRIHILYYPPPDRLTPGQIASVYGSCLGRDVARLSYKSSGELERSWDVCMTPYDVSSETPAPSSAYESRRSWEQARSLFESTDATVPVTVQKIKMSKFELSDAEFVIAADLGQVLNIHGPGVYEVNIFGVVDGNVSLISEYAIFHNISIPAGYESR